jgi:hypothetical protein
MQKIAALVAILLLTGCADSAQDKSPHPKNLVGQWVRLRLDQTWGDTMQFMPDGALRGSAGYPTPPNLTWEVRHYETGKSQYCALQASVGFCRDFRLAGDTLYMFGGPQGNTTFRRVR